MFRSYFNLIEADLDSSYKELIVNPKDLLGFILELERAYDCCVGIPEKNETETLRDLFRTFFNAYINSKKYIMPKGFKLS